MGLIVRACCSCGLDQEVCSGSGMDEGSARLPAWCPKCARLVSVPVEHGPPHCTRCQAPVDPIAIYEPLGYREVPLEEPLACPRCGKVDLRFAPCARETQRVGAWWRPDFRRRAVRT
jgi:hypothetical protein